ncbi:hypothetical protein BaRGS_00007885 [Batillaria attramentaria]|uniref:Tubulin polymerization-promoting protein family member 3 n=1 Tax=Batillaria attramentaria TaxID=370345 RepID=A0ABD0LNA0_9CAEN
MAAGTSAVGDLDKEVKEMFFMCVEKCAGKELPVAEKSECKSNAVNKLFKEVFDGKIANTVDATIFCKYCDKKTKKLTVDAFLNNVLLDLAKHEAVEKKKAKNPANDDPAVLEELNKIKTKIAAKYNEWISSDHKQKNAAVVDRLTDVKGYTGSHKERFDAESGKGKGMEGRVDKTNTSGYVGGYKGEGTFDKSHN